MRRIYHLLDEAEPFSERNGGAISRWAANVLRDGPEIIICPSFDGSWEFAESRLYCLPNWGRTHAVHPLLYRLPWTLQKLVYLQVFRPLLDRLKPGDVLYVQNRPECAAVLATVAKQRGIHLLLHMQNSHLIRANSGQRAAMKDLPISFCSEYIRQECKAAWPEHAGPTHVIRNGADTDKFHASNRSGNPIPEIVFTGRLVPYKGAHVLTKAMQILQDRGVEAKCKIIGGSGFGNSKKSAYIRKLEAGLPGNCEMLGYQSGSDLAALLQQADIFCCPSIWNDPFPLAPLEGMASGLPVVASGTGGIPEALAYGGGSLVPPNDPAALAGSLQRLIEDPSLRMETGRAALRAFREHFLWSNVRDQYSAFLDAVTS